MTTIENIGSVRIARHGAVYLVIDRKEHNIETYTSEREAREAAVERADLYDLISATVH
jgi:hypothetical protein